MKRSKMSLANIEGKLSRAQMKNIMAGSGGGTCNCNSKEDCTTSSPYCVACSGGPKHGVCHAQPA